MDKKIYPLPKGVTRFLRTICSMDLYEEIEGDLIQQFNRHIHTLGYRIALLQLTMTVVRFFRPGILFRRKLKASNNQFDLFNNDFHLALRQLRRDPLFALLNIIGLSTSLAVVLMIAQYAGFHFSFDRNLEHASQEFRVYSRNYEGNKLSFETALTSYKVGPWLKKEFPEVKSYTQLMPTDSWFDCALRYDSPNGPLVYNERKLFYADARFFEHFRCKAIAGDMNSALSNPYSIVLTQSAANRYFHDAHPVGKILHLKGSFEENDYQVSAVIEDLPDNTHLDIDILASLSSLEQNQGVGNNDFYTYLTLHEKADMESFRSKISMRTFDLAADATRRVEHHVQPVTDIHLRSDLQDEIKQGADLNTLYFLIIMGLAIMVIAWINYVNLSMSQIFEKARQVGIRKVNGASRARIVGQFFVGASVLHLISILSAIVVIELTAPLMEALTGTNFTWSAFAAVTVQNPLLYLVLLIVLGIIVSAIYPSVALASLNPVNVLKGKLPSVSKGRQAGNALITFQFACSIMLLTAVFVVHAQYSFMENKKPGVDIDRTLIVKAPTETDSTYKTRFTAFRNYAADNLFVERISTSTSVPGQSIEWTGRVSTRQSAHNMHIQVADTAFLRNYNIPLLSGRDFNVSDYPMGKFGAKIEPVILNVNAIQMLGFPSEGEALGSTIFWGDNECVIVGVVGNYHQQSLRDKIPPILYTANAGPLMSIRLHQNFGKDFYASIVQLEGAWRKFFPDDAFDFFYLPDYYQSHYQSERNIKTIIDVISGLALITSCLGLLGLSAFAAKQKMKEVCIRKLMGARWIEVLGLLSRKFVVLIAVSALIAVPLAIIQSARWLEGYAFHTELASWHFVLPVIIVLLVSSLTIVSQCWKVSTHNPIEVLRSA